ncbi:MAG: HD family hydrolase [Pseudomonadota bacterium]
MTMSKIPRAWQRMLSGRRLNLLDPSPLDVEIADIAYGLARVARWNGQTEGEHAFSVAQHSLLVESVVAYLGATSKNDRLYALLHDAPEYVIGDMISPFKAVMGGGYKEVEARLEAAIHLRHGLKAHPTAKLKKTIKQADRAVAYFEATQLAGFSLQEAEKFFERPAFHAAADTAFDTNTTGQGEHSSPFAAHELIPLSTRSAEQAFLSRFAAIEAMP